MAARRSAEQRREIAAFVKEIYESSGFPSWAEFARQARFPATNLSNVKNAEAGIDGYNLIRLIRAAGGVPSRSAGDEGELQALLQEQQATNAHVERLLEEIVVKLAWLQSRLEEGGDERAAG